MLEINILETRKSERSSKRNPYRVREKLSLNSKREETLPSATFSTAFYKSYLTEEFPDGINASVGMIIPGTPR